MAPAGAGERGGGVQEGGFGGEGEGEGAAVGWGGNLTRGGVEGGGG